jgi:hypothetical protein
MNENNDKSEINELTVSDLRMYLFAGTCIGEVSVPVVVMITLSIIFHGSLQFFLPTTGTLVAFGVGLIAFSALVGRAISLAVYKVVKKSRENELTETPIELCELQVDVDRTTTPEVSEQHKTTPRSID